MPFNVAKPLINYYSHTLLLTVNELKRNALAWLAPLPILLAIICWSSSYGWKPISLNITGTWLYLLTGIILIMVYGLQSFSSEADRKTLDFILTKPISPYSIVFAKYLPGLIIFGGWWYVFNFFLKPNLALLDLPKGIGPEWLVLFLLTVHAVSFFSGLLAKGLERFMVISILTLITGTGAYYLWQKIFTLISINYLWFDIPPRLLFFLEKLLPYYLAGLSVLAPLIGVCWSLKRKNRIWRFKPALGLIGVWLLTLFVIELAGFLFSPPVWPDRNSISGDWHPEKGIILAGTEKKNSDLKTSDNKSYLSLNRNGHKPQIVYTGINLKNPRFAPDGDRIVFSEKGHLIIMDLAKNTSTDIGEGEVATWADDGTKLITAKKIGPKGLSLLYQIDLKSNQTRQLNSEQFEITDLIWDYEQEKLYILGFTAQLYCMNLKDNSIIELQFPEHTKPKFFGVVKPNIRFLKKERLVFIGQVFDRTITIYLLNLENHLVLLSEEKSDFRVLTNGPLIFNQDGTAYLWPRIDGGFVYQATYYDPNHDHDHHHHHDNEHESVHEEP